MVGMTLTPSTSYHPQTDGQTQIVNKWVEGYLINYVADNKRHGSSGLTWGNIVTTPLTICPSVCLHSGPYTVMTLSPL
jgi:hypothetical protein